jgi:poly-gamma-glutamate capsule biosynthesis protein CapA/YwtB (metallophosphatase superfamily)
MMPDYSRQGRRLFLCGDVMLGRGIDQILPFPGDPPLHEEYVRSALTYVTLAERASGPIPRAVDFSYIWGDALTELERSKTDARIINLETSITTSRDFVPKGIHYKMNPKNVPCLTAAKIDCCVLANNHVLDWGVAGLLDTLLGLKAAGMSTAGAGENAEQAFEPAIINIVPGARVLVFGFALESSGVPSEWAAGPDTPGVNLLADLGEEPVARMATKVRERARADDVLIASIHWGGNWGYAVPAAQRALAHDLIDFAGVAIVHGHSSHHAKAIEVYRDRLILFGCGDFLTDYEGISGYEKFRGDLGLMYLPELGEAGRLLALRIVPFRVRRFRLNRAPPEDAAWLQATLERESSPFGTHVILEGDHTLSLRW